MPHQDKSTLASTTASEDPTGSGSNSALGLAAQSDQQLLAGIRDASEPHFNALYERYFQRIYAFVYARVHNHADTEEIVQETFMSVFRSIESYRGQSSLLSWIFGIAKNTANNALRRAKNRRVRLEELDPEVLQPTPSLGSGTHAAIRHMRRYARAMESELGSLARWQREVFEMRHLQNLSIGEIARRSHRSNDAVRSSLYRVKRMLFEVARPSLSRGES